MLIHWEWGCAYGSSTCEEAELDSVLADLRKHGHRIIAVEPSLF